MGKNNHSIFLIWAACIVALAIVCYLLIHRESTVTPAPKTITITWDASASDVTGYEVYQKTNGRYDYGNPVCVTSELSCGIDNVRKDACFVVRSYIETNGEKVYSEKSGEICY